MEEYEFFVNFFMNDNFTQQFKVLEVILQQSCQGVMVNQHIRKDEMAKKTIFTLLSL